MKHGLCAFLMVALAGCVTDQATYLADGTQGVHVTCGGALFSMGDCLKRAGEICGAKGFKVVGSGTEANAFSTANINTYGGSAYSGSIVNRDLIVKCGA